MQFKSKVQFPDVGKMAQDFIDDTMTQLNKDPNTVSPSEKEKPTMREVGYYWCRHKNKNHKNEEWEICWWGGVSEPEWFFRRGEHITFSDDQFAEIDENRLVR